MEKYTAKEIKILRGLEPVRKTPGMYIGSTDEEGVFHLFFEVLSNSIDEAIAGFCNFIEVTLWSEKRIEVKDNGRGIPVETHPETKKSALETVMTYLHKGAKFEKKVYTTSIGLHGVGIAVVNALSKYLKVSVKRDGFEWTQEYSKGVPLGPVKKGKATKETGTCVLFEPDPEIFGKYIRFEREKILNLLRQQAYLTRQIKIRFVDKRPGKKMVYNFYFEGGLLSYLKYLIGQNKLIHENLFFCQGEKEEINVEVAFAFTDEIESLEESFANNVFTPEGGTHLVGFRTALTKVCNEFARKLNLLKKEDEGLVGTDVREGLTAVVSVKLKDPQFEGQTKKKLGNPKVKNVVEQIVSENLRLFFEKEERDCRAILQKAILAQKARKAARSAKEAILRKAAVEGLALPGKLADCTSKDPRERELFLVEGESAGGSAKSARDRNFQAILPLKGKILNIEKARLDKILASEEIKAIVVALGTSIAEKFNLDKLRYHKIIIACDADADGNHIATLLLTLFYRYFPKVIEKGHLYLAQPPLYKIQSGKKVFYAFNDREKEKIVKGLGKNLTIQRYKGLGEMNAEELWETTMNPQKRVLIRVTVEDAKKADQIFDNLMGKEILPRKRFIENYAREAKNLDI